MSAKIVTCFACEQKLFESRTEADHFPSPKRAGGGVTVRLCIPCHDFKDRQPLHHWPLEHSLLAMSGVWGKANRWERLFIMKTHATLAAALHDAREAE